MIYLVNYSLNGFETVSIQKAREALNSITLPYLSCDSESTGFFPANSKMLFFQIGDSKNQYIIFPEDITQFKTILESRTLLGHGFKHDLKFLYSFNIFPSKVLDTHLQELILEGSKYSLGLALKKASLAEVTKKYLDITLDKSQRKKLGLDAESFIYGAKDIVYLEEIYLLQKKRLELLELDIAAELDNRFVKALAYTENTGFKLDIEGWKLKCEKDADALDVAYKELKAAIKNDPRTEDYVVIQSNLFDAPEEVLNINFDSPKDTQGFFENMGIDITVKNKKTINGKNLKKYAAKEPIVKHYLNYKTLTKKISTYGSNILKTAQSFPDDRLRTDFKQIITTGRMSSSSDEESGQGINLQNIPKLSIERRYFTCDPENVLVISDFTGQETRVLAQLANDPTYTSFITDPEKDLHCFMLQCVDPAKYNGYTHKEIKKKFPHERTWVKPGTFCLPYGGNGNTIADNLGISTKEGEEAYNRFMATFPGLEKFYKLQESKSLLNGYIYFNDITKRKAFLPNFDKYKLLRNNKFLKTEDWKLKMKYESSISRLARNYPIQGSSSDMMKMAGIFIFDWIIKQQFQNIVKIVAFVHDEIIVECKKDLSELVKEKVDKAMIKAGKILCPDIPIYTESRISKIWLEEKN